MRFHCRVRPLSAVPVLGRLARGTPWHVWHPSVLRKTLMGTLPPSLSLDRYLPFSPLPPWAPSLLLFIAIFLEPPSAPKGREMTRKVRVVPNCDCSPPKPFCKGEQLQKWAALGRKSPWQKGGHRGRQSYQVWPLRVLCHSDRTCSSNVAMIHGFSLFFYFALSSLGRIPFKKSQTQSHLSWTPLWREEGIFWSSQHSLGHQSALGRQEQNQAGTEEGRGPRAFPSPTCPGFLRGQARLSLQGFRNVDAVKRKVKQINNMELLDPWTLRENPFEKYLQGIWFVFPFRRESNGDGEESRSAWRPGILSKLRRSERTCYLLEPDICCCEMISSLKNPGHQLLLIQPSSRRSCFTILPAFTNQAVPGTEQLQPSSASLLPLGRTPQAIFYRPCICVPGFFWFHSLALLRSALRTEPHPTPFGSVLPSCFLSGKQG